MHDSPAYSPASRHLLRLALYGSISLLLLSTFRAPEGMESLQSVVAKFKILIRFTVLGGLGFLLAVLVGRYRLGVQVIWHLPFLAFAAWGLTSVLWSARPDESFGQVISLMTLMLVSLGVSILLEQEDHLSGLIRFITLNLMALCAFLLVSGLLIPSTGHMTRDGLGLGHATNCGSTASLGLVILIGCAALWDWRWIRVWMIPGCLLFIAVAGFSSNRLSLAITALIIPSVWLCYGNRRVLGLALIFAMVAGNLYLWLDPSFSTVSSVLQTVNRDQSAEEISSLSGRQEMWQAIWQSFLTSPWIGHGYFMSSSTGEIEVWYINGEMLGANWTAHNIWLQALVSTGVIGLSLFVVALFTPVVMTCFQAAYERDWKKINSWFVILLVWYLLWGVLNESFLGPLQPESVVFFLLYGTQIALLSKNLMLPQNAFRFSFGRTTRNQTVAQLGEASVT